MEREGSMFSKELLLFPQQDWFVSPWLLTEQESESVVFRGNVSHTRTVGATGQAFEMALDNE